MSRRRPIATCVLAIGLSAFACGGSSGTLDIQLTSAPNPPKMGANAFDVTVKQANGTPVTDAVVTLECHMPAMPSMNMAEMRVTATLTHQSGGTYHGEAQLASPGNWDTTVTVRRGGETLGTRTLTLAAQP